MYVEISISLFFGMIGFILRYPFDNYSNCSNISGRTASSLVVFVGVVYVEIEISLFGVNIHLGVSYISANYSVFYSLRLFAFKFLTFIWVVLIGVILTQAI